MDFTYGYFKKSADYLKTIVPWEPEIALETTLAAFGSVLAR